MYRNSQTPEVKKGEGNFRNQQPGSSKATAIVALMERQRPGLSAVPGCGVERGMRSFRNYVIYGQDTMILKCWRFPPGFYSVGDRDTYGMPPSSSQSVRYDY